jgi:peptidoglycan hydrolase-like protein with peptidoglycan-binding domain
MMLAQSALQQSGYYHGPVDGNLSKSARQALMDFQKDDGLGVTGELDDEVFSRLLALRHERVYATHLEIVLGNFVQYTDERDLPKLKSPREFPRFNQPSYVKTTINFNEHQ